MAAFLLYTSADIPLILRGRNFCRHKNIYSFEHKVYQENNACPRVTYFVYNGKFHYEFLTFITID